MNPLDAISVTSVRIIGPLPVRPERKTGKMADLVVDLDLLASMAGALSMLIEEFSNASAIVGSYQDAVGDPTLVAALHAFSGDWAVHRQDLLSSMESVYKMATQSRKAYIATDDKLAQDLKKDAVAPVLKGTR